MVTAGDLSKLIVDNEGKHQHKRCCSTAQHS